MGEIVLATAIFISCSVPSLERKSITQCTASVGTKAREVFVGRLHSWEDWGQSHIWNSLYNPGVPISTGYAGKKTPAKRYLGLPVFWDEQNFNPLGDGMLSGPPMRAHIHKSFRKLLKDLMHTMYERIPLTELKHDWHFGIFRLYSKLNDNWSWFSG